MTSRPNGTIPMTVQIAWVATLAILLMLALILNSTAKPTEAAPMLAPTPVANVLPSGGSAKIVEFLSNAVLTMTTASAKQTLGNIKAMDVQLTIDQTAVNTITVIAQHINTGNTWADGATLVSNNTADSTIMTQIANFGANTRFLVTTANTNPVTITINANIVVVSP